MNNDLISRQAAIDAINHICPVDTEYDCTLLDRVDIRCVLSDLPSAQRWTPVSEGLPKKSGRYLVTRGLNACGAVWNRVYIINYSDLMGLKSERIWRDGNIGKSDFEEITDVIAWMPLPEPYKERREEG